MRQIYPDVGLLNWLSRMLSANLHYHLFSNNVTPDRDTVLGDLTEVAVTGYSVADVALAAFTLSGVTGHVGTLLAAPVSFLNSSGSPANAYGYYVTDPTDAILLAVARFDSAPISKADGESWIVTPTISDLSQYST